MTRSAATGRKGKASKANTSAKVEDTTDPVESAAPEVSDESVKEEVVDSLEHLKSKGIIDTIASGFNSLITGGFLLLNEMTESVYETLVDFPEANIQAAVVEFKESDFSSVNDKMIHLISVFKSWKEVKLKDGNPGGESGTSAITDTTIEQSNKYGENKVGPDEAKVQELLQRTKYPLDIQKGMRRYGPAPDWPADKPAPQHIAFVGRVPRDMFEDELIPVLEEKGGKLYEVKLMVNPMNELNRGYVFATFCEKDDLTKAVDQLNGYEIRPGAPPIQCNISTPNLRLFVGNIPKVKTREEILEEFKKLTDGIVDVIVYTVFDDPNKHNRGFAFIDFDSHDSAADAKRKFSGRNGLKVWDKSVFADWADQMDVPDDDIMATVKILYVKNISNEITDEELKAKFGEFGEVEKVKKVKDYAFVHFVERDSAIKAMEALNNQEIGKAKVDISLARPPSDKMLQKKQNRQWQKESFGGGYDPHSGFGGGYGGGGWGMGFDAYAAPRPPFAGRMPPRGGYGGGYGPPGFGGRGGPMGPFPRGGGMRPPFRPPGYGAWGAPPFLGFGGGGYGGPAYPPGAYGGGGYWGGAGGYGGGRGGRGFGGGDRRGAGRWGGQRGGRKRNAEDAAGGGDNVDNKKVRSDGGAANGATASGANATSNGATGPASTNDWGTQPIAQQPLDSLDSFGDGTGETWA